MSSKHSQATVPPIHALFRKLQSRERVKIWLYENDFRLEGDLRGFDEYMNIVLGNVQEVHPKREATSTKAGCDETRIDIGNIMLKGENVTVIQGVEKQ